MRVKASDSERERLSIVLAETNVKVDALEKDAVEGKDKIEIHNAKQMILIKFRLYINRLKFYNMHLLRYKKVSNFESDKTSRSQLCQNVIGTT